MARPGHAEGFREVVVYQKAREVARRIYEVTRSFPSQETFSLTDQVRRSSRAVGAQIAEAWAKRRYTKHFVSKLTDADGEQRETQHWVEVAQDCGYLASGDAEDIVRRLSEIGRMLNSMMDKADLFCGRGSDGVRESAPEYFLGQL